MHSGTTMMELVIFLAIFAMAAGVVSGVLISTSENRLRQQTVSAVDQNGTQLLQATTRLIRRGERILYPARGESGSTLIMQMGSDTENPTLLTVSTGALMLYKVESGSVLSPDTVVVENFTVRNTSASQDHGSVYISFTISKTIAETFFSHERTFESAVTLFSDDLTQGDECECALPACNAGVLTWNVCEEDVCRASSKTLTCN